MTKSPSASDRRIGRHIRLQRVASGMSQHRLAEALGLTFQQVQKYEKGTNRVSASRLEEIAGVLKVPVAFFYDDAAGEASPPLAAETPQGLLLLRAFEAIAHPGLQKQVLALVRSVAAMKTCEACSNR